MGRPRPQKSAKQYRPDRAPQQASDSLESLLGLMQMAGCPASQVISFALEEAVRRTGSEMGYVAFSTEGEEVLVMHSWSKAALQQCQMQDKPLVYPLAGTGLWGEPVRRRSPVITNSYRRNCKGVKGTPVGHVRLKRHLGVPVLDGDCLVGTAGVANKAAPYRNADAQQLMVLMLAMWRILQRNKAEELVREQARLVMQLATAGSVGEAATAALETALRISSLDSAVVYLGGDEGGDSRLVERVGEPDLVLETATRYRFQTLAEGKAQRDSPEYLEARPSAETAGGFQSVAFVPVLHGTALFGCLGLSSRRAAKLPEPARPVLRSLGIQLGAALARLRTSEAELESQQQFATLFSRVGDYVVVADPSGRVLEANAAALKGLGYCREELLALPIAELFPSESRKSSLESLQDLVRMRQAIAVLPLLTKSQEVIQVEIKVVAGRWGRQEAVFGVGRRLTDREELVGKLARSEALLRGVFENMAAGTLVTDAQGTILLANPYAAGMLGASGERALQGRWLQEVSPQLADMLLRGPRGDRGQREIDLPTGRRMLGITVARAQNQDLRILLFRDQTCLVEREARRVRAEQLAQVGELAAKLSHEIKNPLSTVLAGLQLVRKEAGLGLRDKERLEEAIGEARRIETAVQSVLDSARLNPFCPERGPLLSHLLAAVFPYQQLCQTENLKLEIEWPPAELKVVVDPAWFRRLLGNLIMNAVEATPAGGWIRVRAYKTPEAERSTLFPWFPGEVVAVEVADSGPGIPPLLADRVFDPFFTTKASGTGLGLALAEEIVDTLGGSLRLTQPPGQGALFTLYLVTGEHFTCVSRKGHEGCEHCAVLREQAGYCCWAAQARAEKSEAGRWPERCLRCEVFQAGHLGAQLRAYVAKENKA